MENVLNKFHGVKIDLEDFKATLDVLKYKSVIVELFKGINTMQNYNNFDWNTYKGLLCLDDYNLEKPSISFNTRDIAEIIEGMGIYSEHYLIKLKNGMEIMLLEE